MNIVDRRLNREGKSLEQSPAFPAARRRRCKRAVRRTSQDARSRMSSTAASLHPGRGMQRAELPPQPGRPPRHVVPGNKDTSRATRSRKAKGGGGRRPEGRRRQRRRRFPLRAVPGRVPRPVLRGSGAPRSGQREPEGTSSRSLRRAGYTTSGHPPTSRIGRTMRNSFGAPHRAAPPAARESD